MALLCVIWFLLLLKGTTAQDGCGNTELIVARSTPGIISFPNFIRPLDCAWRIITSTPGYRIELKVNDSRMYRDDYNCSYDHVDVHDGPSLFYVKLEDWCSQPTPIFLSSKNYLTIRYVSGRSSKDIRFSLTYREFFGSASNVLPICHGSGGSGVPLPARSTYGTLESANYPDYYYSDQDCIWNLQAIYNGFIIELSTIDFDLEVCASCRCDYVEVFDGPSMASRSIRRWCGRDTPTLYSTGSAMTIRFHTDGWKNNSGFRMWYRQIRENELPDSVNVGGIVAGAVMGSFVLFISVVIVVFIARRKTCVRYQDTERRHTTTARGRCRRAGTQNPLFATVLSAAPPPYEDHVLYPRYLGEPFPEYQFDHPPAYPATKYIVSLPILFENQAGEGRDERIEHQQTELVNMCDPTLFSRGEVNNAFADDSLV